VNRAEQCLHSTSESGDLVTIHLKRLLRVWYCIRIRIRACADGVGECYLIDGCRSVVVWLNWLMN
jgi:hypothetical protein